MSRRNLLDGQAGETEVPPAGPRAGSNDRANAAVPPAPGPADPDAHERRRHSLTEFICAAFDQQIARVKALLAENSSRSLKSESHLPLVAQCQEETTSNSRREQSREWGLRWQRKPAWDRDN